MNIQEQALSYISRFNLDELLSRYGEAHLVGNVALGTTVKPDIDYSIYLERAKWPGVIANIKLDFEKFGLTNFHERELKESGKYLLSFDFEDDSSAKWSIDVTLTEKSGDYLTDSYQFLLDFKDNFTKQKIAQILPLKKYFYKKGMLKNSMSYYIYRAVIDENVSTVNEMYDYLKRNKINIGRFKR
jgi:hypothetical protein